MGFSPLCNPGDSGPRPSRPVPKPEKAKRRLLDNAKRSLTTRGNSKRPELTPYSTPKGLLHSTGSRMAHEEIDPWVSRAVKIHHWGPENTNPDKLLANMIKRADPEEWYIEYGDPKVHAEGCLEPSQLEILFQSDDIPFYAQHLYETEHAHYIGLPEEGIDAPPGPVIASVELKSKQKQQDKLKCIIRTKEETKRIYLPIDMNFQKCLQRIPDLSLLRWERVKAPEISKQLLNMEERAILGNYKFGVLYSKDPKTENDLFAVTEKQASSDYKEFLEFLGEKISLEGWSGYRGGLDVKTNTTGTHSIYTKFQNHEIMFHVATLLPSQEADEQRLERKRHIGNDVVAIVFHESDSPFNVNIITTQFIRVIVVIKKLKKASSAEKSRYSMVIANRRGVGEYTPPLPHPPIFEVDQNFRNFLLTKCINAEKVALKAADIQIKMARTNGQLLAHLVNTYTTKGETKKKK
eukprot:TRINITY_DN14811_c0_g1_i2.p1 TRINITY_DN14811_c0_g1~~TRINITY_DN14811_c0_g1_i2.p1  ORF type:complete len:464 (+),score=97.26 TRINITY_DN14811_c0_g1_i2:92-1483(+)